MESPAGQFTAKATELWGSVAALTVDLQRPLVRRVLDAFQSRAASGEVPGNYIADRRYLSADDLATVAGDSGEVTVFIDWCLHAGVLRRGLSLACANCSYFGWYDANEIGQSFRCWRCRSEMVVDSKTVRGGGTEPRWYYALAEVVYQACRLNFSVPLLALHRLADGAQSVLSMPEHGLWFPSDNDAEGGDRIEIDLWCVVDGRIVIGEAKKGGDLEATARKRAEKARLLRRTADTLEVDTLVLATAADSWAPGTIQVIEAAFAGGRCNVELLTGVDPYLNPPSKP